MREVKPTQKPVPSSDIKDLFFNSGLLDIWATSLEHKYIDRFGNCHLTAAGMEWLFKELVEKFKVDMNTAIVAAGYITIDSFQKGADLPNNEITLRNHILRDETTGEYYRWDGDLPKSVPAGSTPQTTGGIGKGAWVSVGDASLRSGLLGVDGQSFIGSANYDDVRNYTGVNKKINVYGRSFYLDGGEGLFVLDDSDSTSKDNDGTVLIDALNRRWKREFNDSIYLEWFGAIGDASIDPVSGAVSGTDCTESIKKVVKWMNSLNTIGPELGGAFGLTLKGKSGSTYRVSGNNILGNQRAESGELTKLACSFSFDGNGCNFIWTPVTGNDSWIDYAATYYRPSIVNYRLIVAGNVNARAYLRSNSGVSGNVFQEGVFDDVVVVAGYNPAESKWRAGNFIESVFEIDGNLLQDRCLCRRSKFQQFKRLFKSSAQEAVAWVMDGTTFWTWVDNANYIEITKTFSGAHTHIACDAVFYGNNSKLVYMNADNYASYKNNGELYIIATRIETKPSKQFTAVWANHGKIVIEGLNCRLGNNNFNAQTNYISAEVYNDASVVFRNCVLPSRTRMMISPRDSISEYPSFFNSYGAIFENCEFQNYQYRPEYVTLTGTVVSYRSAIEGQYYARNTKVTGSKSGNGVYGNCDIADNMSVTLPLFTYNANGESYIDSSVQTPIQASCIISDISLLIPEDTGMTKIDVKVGSTVIKTINIEGGVKNKISVIPSSDWGIASPTEGAGARVSFQPYNGSNAIQRAKGFGVITTRPARCLYEITDSDIPKLI